MRISLDKMYIRVAGKHISGTGHPPVGVGPGHTTSPSAQFAGQFTGQSPAGAMQVPAVGHPPAIGPGHITSPCPQNVGQIAAHSGVGLGIHVGATGHGVVVGPEHEIAPSPQIAMSPQSGAAGIVGQSWPMTNGKRKAKAKSFMSVDGETFLMTKRRLVEKM